MPTAAHKTAPRNFTDVETCLCGCGQPVGPRSIFKQGHDARLVSQAARAMIGEGDVPQVVRPDRYDPRIDIQQRINDVTRRFEAVLSDALATKFHNAAMRAWQNHDKPKAPRKATAKAAPATPPADHAEWHDAGTVRVGRWAYPARYWNDHAVRNTKRDGSGEWVPCDEAARAQVYAATDHGTTATA